MSFTAIVLAAGAGKRFGGGKMTALFAGEPLLAHAIRAAQAAPVERVIVVCAPGLEIGTWTASPPVEALPVASTELSASLKAGIAAATACDGAFVFLGDMPLIPHGLASKLAQALGRSFAAVPRHQGRNGHPVLLSSQAFPEIARLSGDQGAARLLAGRSDIAFVEAGDDRILVDIDHADDIARLERRGD